MLLSPYCFKSPNKHPLESDILELSLMHFVFIKPPTESMPHIRHAYWSSDEITVCRKRISMKEGSQGETRKSPAF